MPQLTEKINHPCWAEFKCYYKVNNSCTYWDQVKAMLSVLQEKQHKGARCCLELIDILREPCLELDEEGRRRGVGNILGPTE